ncbi:MAG TPA: efflux transporter outer membrane subunit [Albitalea sp.]|jgi:multidrug efflux system outer membrane protein|nr:efflux transporter outer membrane subunit [Albitalea sp.]
MTERRVLHRAVALAAALLASGCMSLAPRYERPPAPVPSGFVGEAAGAANATPAADIAWQQYFGDARLKRLIAAALVNNRDLRIAVLNIEQARAQVQLRRADLWPTVGVGLGLSRQPSVDRNTSGITSLYTAGLAVTAYELDLFGRLRNLGDAAAAQLLATEEARKTVQISLIASVATTYLASLADDELLRVTRDALVTREESFKLTKLKFDHGATSEIDFRLAESLLESARVALAQQTRQRQLDENALMLLLGQSLPADLPPPLPVTSQQMVADLPAGVPSEVLVRRPDVRAAEQQLIAAHANIGAARAAFFPRITLTGSVGTASTELSGLFKSGSLAWTFAPQLLLPLFDAGRNQANLDSAKVNREIAVAQYEKAIQTAFREVSDALAGRATLTEQVRAQRAQANAEAVRTRLAELRYSNGVASYLDVLDAQRSLFAAQQAVVQTETLQAQTLVVLYKVLGGGWTP